MAQFLFRFDRPFFWPAAGLTPETYSFIAWYSITHLCFEFVFLVIEYYLLFPGEPGLGP